MSVGKVSGTILKRSVVNLLKCPKRTGIDAAAFECGEEHILSANAVGLTDSILAPDIAVYKAANNIWASGGELLGMEASFLLPKSYNEYNLKAYTKRVKAACERCGTVLSGGHTEVSDAVKRFCISTTAIGRCNGRITSVKNITPGMDIIITKWIALEEIAMISAVEENMNSLLTRFSAEYLEVLKNYEQWLMVREEAAVALQAGAKAMHDISEGGAFTALWDMAEGSGCGFEVDLRAIPIRQDTIEVAEFFHLNPYKLKSSGSLIIISDNGQDILDALEEAGIPASLVGHTTDDNNKILHNEDEIRYLDKN